jgi:large subunit ribosomal protein L7/L12
VSKKANNFKILKNKEENKMAKLTREDFISSLKEMTLLEIKDLVDAMKEEFGVDPSAVAVAAAPAAGAAAEEGPTSATVVLANAGANKIAVIKVIRDITGLGLKEAKDIADAGGNVKENVKIDEANEIKAKLEEAGATVELK